MAKIRHSCWMQVLQISLELNVINLFVRSVDTSMNYGNRVELAAQLVLSRVCSDSLCPSIQMKKELVITVNKPRHKILKEECILWALITKLPIMDQNLIGSL